MTNFEKVQFLSQYLKLDRLIDNKLSECEKWRARAEKMSPSYSALPKVNTAENSLELAMEHIVELEIEIQEEVCKLFKLRQSIQQVINTVKDDTLKELLEYRYISGYKCEKIAQEMHYSGRQIIRLHAKALNGLSQDVIECHL